MGALINHLQHLIKTTKNGGCYNNDKNIDRKVKRLTDKWKKKKKKTTAQQGFGN